MPCPSLAAGPSTRVPSIVWARSLRPNARGPAPEDGRSQANQVSAEEGEPPYYLIEYLVESSRGRKVYLCKYCINNQKLYVLQAQAKQDTFDAANDASVRETLAAAVASFGVLGG